MTVGDSGQVEVFGERFHEGRAILRVVILNASDEDT
jgi:hypothetical protein